MCGLFGFQWRRNRMPSTSQRERLSVALALYADLRGGHAWGYYDDRGTLGKGLGHAAPHGALFARASTLIGHTRYGTVGANSTDNAHPYKFGSTVGAHNGVLTNHRELDAAWGALDVDSMHLIRALEMKHDLSKITGYGAATWATESAPGEIRMGRLTASGELSVLQTRQGLVWGSNGDHLRRALAAAGLEVTKTYRIDAGSVYLAQRGTLFITQDSCRIKERASWASMALTSGGKVTPRADLTTIDPRDPWGDTEDEDLESGTAFDALVACGYDPTELAGLSEYELEMVAFDETNWSPPEAMNLGVD